ncbi:MAG TPA: PIG-L family deacetylase [Nonomuraea sp.]|nr:PIG-L family deacetylase [Nonomuraea sp.]
MAAAAALVALLPMGGMGIAAFASTTADSSFMQVVAHEDDDLLFMNPDIDDSIRAGMASVTVFMTAGQITGTGNTDEQRARNRQRGIQDAYARMAGVPDANPAAQEEWHGTAWSIAGRQVERYTLTDHPQVQLVFMNLRDDQLGWYYAVDDFIDHTVIPENGLVSQSFSYVFDDVGAVLAGLMDHYRPTVLRGQDPLPDSRYNPGHGDHVAAAKFAADAAESYGSPLVQVNYRDYNIEDVPVNLSVQARDRKSAILGNYLHYDPFDPEGWQLRMYYRWARGTAWAGRNADGRPQIFVVRSGVVSTYAQTTSGEWDGPSVLGGAGGPLAPAVSVGRNADGRLQIFAHRLSDHHIVSIRQTAVNGGWPAGWTDLGNPNLNQDNEDQIGVPAVAADGAGRLRIFVKNGAGGVSTRYQSAVNGGWGTWVNLHGSDVQDGLTAITNPLGGIELFASTRSRILHWYQPTATAAFVLDSALPSMTPAGPPTAALSQDGRIEVAYRRAGTAEMVVSYQVAAGGPWSLNPAVIGGHAGVGEPALITTSPGPDARILMFQRNGDAGVSMTKQLSPNAGYGGWTDLGGAITDYPAASLDPSGAVVLFAVGTDGVVYVREQATPGADSPFGNWEALQPAASAG